MNNLHMVTKTNWSHNQRCSRIFGDVYEIIILFYFIFSCFTFLPVSNKLTCAIFHLEAFSYYSKTLVTSGATLMISVCAWLNYLFTSICKPNHWPCKKKKKENLKRISFKEQRFLFILLSRYKWITGFTFLCMFWNSARYLCCIRGRITYKFHLAEYNGSTNCRIC